MASEQSIFSKKAGDALTDFYNLIQTVKSILEKDDLPYQINEIIKISKMKSMYEKNKTEQARSKLENLDELVSAAQEFLNADTDENETIIDAFLTHTSLESGEGQGSEWDKCHSNDDTSFIKRPRISNSFLGRIGRKFISK